MNLFDLIIKKKSQVFVSSRIKMSVCDQYATCAGFNFKLIILYK